MTHDVSLLLSDWQGCHSRPETGAAARQIAERLFDEREFVEMPAPVASAPVSRDGVFFLDGIAERCRLTLAALAARRPDRLFVVGATCGVEVAPVTYLNGRYAGDLAVIWIDAHADLNTHASSPSGNFHGMALRTLLGDGPPPLVAQLVRPLAPRHVFLAGARDLDLPEAAFVERSGIAARWVRDLTDPPALVARVRAAGFSRVYLHLDLDVLDPAAFPDALMAAPGGASVADLAATVQALAGAFDVVGFSVVEFALKTPDGLERLRSLLAACPIAIGAMATLRR